jgi:hypothetical protein
MPGPLQDATVRVRLALLDGVLDHFPTTGGVLVAMVQLGG